MLVLIPLAFFTLDHCQGKSALKHVDGPSSQPNARWALSSSQAAQMPAPECPL